MNCPIPRGNLVPPRANLRLVLLADGVELVEKLGRKDVVVESRARDVLRESHAAGGEPPRRVVRVGFDRSLLHQRLELELRLVHLSLVALQPREHRALHLLHVPQDVLRVPVLSTGVVVSRALLSLQRLRLSVPSRDVVAHGGAALLSDGHLAIALLLGHREPLRALHRRRRVGHLLIPLRLVLLRGGYLVRLRGVVNRQP